MPGPIRTILAAVDSSCTRPEEEWRAMLKVSSFQSRHAKIARIGNHLPRPCGIATFTTDLLAALAGEASDTESTIVWLLSLLHLYEIRSLQVSAAASEAVEVDPAREKAGGVH